jgi:hypothetical protein
MHILSLACDNPDVDLVRIIVLLHWQSTQSYKPFSQLLSMTTIASIIRNRLKIFDSWKCSYWFGDWTISSCSDVLGARGASEPASPLPYPPSQLLSIVRVFHNHNRSPKIWT